MSRPALALVAVAAAAAAAWALWHVLWPDERARVAAAVGALARAGTAVAAADPGIGRVGVLRDLAGLLTEDVEVEVPERGVRAQGRDQLLGLAAATATRPDRPVLRFEDVTVTLGEDGATASVAATARLDASDPTGRAVLDATEVTLRFVRRDGAWLLRAATAVDVIR